MVVDTNSFYYANLTSKQAYKHVINNELSIEDAKPLLSDYHKKRLKIYEMPVRIAEAPEGHIAVPRMVLERLKGNTRKERNAIIFCWFIWRHPKKWLCSKLMQYFTLPFICDCYKLLRESKLMKDYKATNKKIVNRVFFFINYFDLVTIKLNSRDSTYIDTLRTKL